MIYYKANRNGQILKIICLQKEGCTQRRAAPRTTDEN